MKAIEKKKEFEAVKKTAKAHGTLSEEEAEKMAKDSNEITKNLLESNFEIESEAEKVLKEEIKKDVLEKVIQSNNILPLWEPKTKLGQEVKSGKIRNIDEIIESNRKILEPEIVDSLLQLKTDLISIGQSKGKFGGGKRRAWRQTQRKTEEGNIATFSTLAVVGDEEGHVGIGDGRAKETLPARDKAIRKAKLNIMRVKRTCSAFDCSCNELHTIPFRVEGKSGSSRVILIPAPQGTGLVVGRELKKVLILAGVKDIYSKTFGKQRTTFNLIKAGIDALSKTTK